MAMAFDLSGCSNERTGTCMLGLRLYPISGNSCIYNGGLECNDFIEPNVGNIPSSSKTG